MYIVTVSSTPKLLILATTSFLKCSSACFFFRVTVSVSSQKIFTVLWLELYESNGLLGSADISSSLPIWQLLEPRQSLSLPGM